MIFVIDNTEQGNDFSLLWKLGIEEWSVQARHVLYHEVMHSFRNLFAKIQIFLIWN